MAYAIRAIPPTQPCQAPSFIPNQRKKSPTARAATPSRIRIPHSTPVPIASAPLAAAADFPPFAFALSFKASHRKLTPKIAATKRMAPNHSGIVTPQSSLIDTSSFRGVIVGVASKIARYGPGITEMLASEGVHTNSCIKTNQNYGCY